MAAFNFWGKVSVSRAEMVTLVLFMIIKAIMDLTEEFGKYKKETTHKFPAYI